MISSTRSILTSNSRLIVKSYPLVLRATYSATSSKSDEVSYTERQMKLGRPVSPHVTVYKFPIAAISSITNRVTGVGLSVGISGIAAVSLFGGDAAGLMTTIGNSTIGPVAKMAVAFPLVFHYMAGVRHLMWDANPDNTLENDKVEQSSFVLFGAASAVTLVLAMVSI